MGDRFQRHLGSLAEMDPGQWCSIPPRPRTSIAIVVHLRCPACSGIHEVDASRIARDGGVVPIWDCPTATCSLRAFISLESWSEAFDTTDVKPC